MRTRARIAALTAALTLVMHGGIAAAQAKPANKATAAKPAASSKSSAAVERGRYLAKIAGCNDCHTPGYLLNAGKVPENMWLTGSDLGCFIAHQANIRIIEAAAEKLGFAPEKVIRNIHKFGNTTAGTIPLAIGDALDDGRLKKGDLVLFSAVGAGFTSGTVLLRWAY